MCCADRGAYRIWSATRGGDGETEVAPPRTASAAGDRRCVALPHQVWYEKFQFSRPFFIIIIIRTGNAYYAIAVSTEGLFRIAGTHARVQELCVKASSSADIDFDIHEVPHNVSAMLTKYLRELPEPVLGVGNYDNFLTAVGTPPRLVSHFCEI